MSTPTKELRTMERRTLKRVDDDEYRKVDEVQDLTSEHFGPNDVSKMIENKLCLKDPKVRNLFFCKLCFMPMKWTFFL